MYHRECCDVVPSPNFGYIRCAIEVSHALHDAHLTARMPRRS